MLGGHGHARHALAPVAAVVAALLGISLAMVPPAAGAATSIPWGPCAGAPGYLCGSLQVPLNYAHRSGPTIALSVIEHPATEAPGDGVLLFNPGGPGESGVIDLPVLASLFPSAVRDDFTLVSFDERGTGTSSPLRCGPSPTAAASAVPFSASGVNVFARLPTDCAAKYPGLLSGVTTLNAAKDMDRIRAALGASQISYYGLSYGTVLGALYAQLFPGRVRAMVLDGAVDTNLSLSRQATEEAPAIDAALRSALPPCAAPASCPLGARPLATYSALESRLLLHPLPAPGGGDTTPVTVGDLFNATLLYLSVPAFFGGYPAALEAAAAGNGAPLRALSVQFYEDVGGASLVAPEWAYACNDATAHPSARASALLARRLSASSPLAGAAAVSNNLIGCVGWRPGSGTVPTLVRTSAPTPLVIATTGDPNTPYTGVAQLSAVIGGRLVTNVAAGHTWLLNDSTNACMEGVVTSYLVDRAPPQAGERCSS